MGARSSNTDRKGHRANSENVLLNGHCAYFYNSSLNSGGGATAAVPIVPVIASGGTKSTPGDGYAYHLFTSGGNFTVTAGNAALDILLVGGGGGGGYDRGGGGGAGAFYPLTLNAVTGTHPVTLGAGGAGDSSIPGADGGTPGSDTTFVLDSTPYVANGGGGGSGDGGTNGLSSPGNGSGGGTTGSPINASPWDAGVGGAYGNPGRGSNRNGTGGGGGGAGSGGPNAGYQPATSTTAQVGGDGATLPWIPTSYGVSGYFCGGGGGGGKQYPTSATNPSPPGGGGRGGGGGAPGTGANATANTGSGGGGGNATAGNGAQGIVLIRYASA